MSSGGRVLRDPPPFGAKLSLYKVSRPFHSPRPMALADLLSISINLLLVVFVIVCLLMTLLILMQRPKQEGLGAAFGGGVTDQVFGARTTNVLQKGTVYLASAFFLLSLTLAVLIGHKNRTKSLVEEKPKQEAAAAKEPAPAPAPTPAPVSAPEGPKALAPTDGSSAPTPAPADNAAKELAPPSGTPAPVEAPGSEAQPPSAPSAPEAPQPAAPNAVPSPPEAAPSAPSSPSAEDRPGQP